MQWVSTRVNWRKNVKSEPKWTRIIAVRYELVAHSTMIKYGPLSAIAKSLNAAKDHCFLSVRSYIDHLRSRSQTDSGLCCTR